jgi:prevent-host-death family protein
MTTIEIKQAKRSLAQYAREAGTEPVVVTSRGKPVAAVVPIANADLETVGLSTSRQFLALIERSRTRHNRQGGISPAEMRRRLGLK